MPRSFYDISNDQGEKRRTYRVWGGLLAIDAGCSVYLEDITFSSIRIARSIWRGRGSYRRSVAVVRKVEKGHYRILFVKGGRIVSGGDERLAEVGSDHFTLIDVKAAYTMEFLPDENGALMVYTVLVPEYILTPLIAPQPVLERAFETTKGTGALARALVELLFWEGESLPSEICDQSISLLLTLVANCVRQPDLLPFGRSSHSRRFDDAKAYIRANLADPNLSARSLAAYLGISARYLSIVLKQNGTTFPVLLRGSRAAVAREMLEADRMRGHQISEIAALTGFETNSHFSRVFKQEFGVSPAKFRQNAAYSGQLD